MIALRLVSLLARMWVFLAIAMIAATPAVLAVVFLLPRTGAPGWLTFVSMIAVVIVALILSQPVADRLVNEHRFRCAGCGGSTARFRWVGPARKNQPHEFVCESCGRSDVNTVIGTVVGLFGQR